METASAVGESDLLELYDTAAAGLLLSDPGSLTDYRLLPLPDQSRQKVYNISYSVDGSVYQNSFTSDSKYQLPLKAFDGVLRIENGGGAGFCCFSVSEAKDEYWEEDYWEEDYWDEDYWDEEDW